MLQFTVCCKLFHTGRLLQLQGFWGFYALGVSPDSKAKFETIYTLNYRSAICMKCRISSLSESVVRKCRPTAIVTIDPAAALCSKPSNCNYNNRSGCSTLQQTANLAWSAGVERCLALRRSWHARPRSSRLQRWHPSQRIGPLVRITSPDKTFHHGRFVANGQPVSPLWSGQWVNFNKINDLQWWRTIVAYDPPPRQYYCAMTHPQMFHTNQTTKTNHRVRYEACALEFQETTPPPLRGSKPRRTRRKFFG